MRNEKWKDASWKEKIQYSSAVLLIVSAVVLAYISFIIVNDIGYGVLAYVLQAFGTACGIFGIGVYAAKKVGEIENQILDKLKRDT